MKDTQFMKAYTIKEVSRKINVPSGTIRQWEKDLEGLLVVPRTRQGARFYTEQEIELLAKIKQMRSKNLSKDMIRELLQKHMNLVSQGTSEHAPSANLPIVPENVPVQQAQPPASAKQQEFDMEGFFQALENYKQDLLHDVKMEIRNNLRSEFVDEVKKDIASGSLQTIKALSLSISRSKERMKSDIDELSKQVAKASEHTSETVENFSSQVLSTAKGTEEKVGSLSQDVAKLSKGTAKEISNLTQSVSKVTASTKKEVTALKENVAKLSKGTAKEMSTLSSSIAKLSKGTSEELRSLASRLDESSDEFKILTEYIAQNKEMTAAELSTLNEQLAMDREYYLETLKLERENFRGEIQHRDEVFKGMVDSFREAAAAKTETSKKWWKPWKS